MLQTVPDSIARRWLLAVVAALLFALAINFCFSRTGRKAAAERRDPAAVWKERTGVDLAALPRQSPAQEDSADARGLDLLLRPLSLHLGGRSSAPRPFEDGRNATAELDALRDALRNAIQATSTEPQPFPRDVTALLERHAAMLDAVAAYVASHPDIRWREDLEPRPVRSILYTDDHLTLHRLLIGRAFLALDRHDDASASRMLQTSRALGAVMEKRHELQSQLVATGVERLQLAVMRRAGNTFGVALPEPRAGIRERFVSAMSNEAALVLRSSDKSAFRADRDAPEHVFRVVVGAKYELAAADAIEKAAAGVDEIRRASDDCVALRKDRAPTGMFASDFYSLDATASWRRFVVLELDRAITRAVLTGVTSTPCPTVAIKVRDEGVMRTVEADGIPVDAQRVVPLPSIVTTRIKR